ncbi:D-2-hydroxyacid dehydrogenase family protein [Saccharomonospora viridis]|mgnify:CR=1 FL=1|jgi:phosphoglycerate dehydrogenase-like enzyme|uniref:Phosphoglycerate dehydrogenase-like oxidoreductase n=2 Tax=Saccharomonospora viridis TaxID=1852 RepID=C7MSG9_SACVD|nr:D-2-hydroxyacid dehydrogenase family protein [Saccharomonospora viridis]ACU96567.1 phosphoglycerate dehydrogenase-like oxidoreductase [Saccharomonospora viridis DSM 43017]KHF42711.1 2-hydroxyacid dehydrogenase [Saccharomonospora viridis]SFO93394.1 Phosphoglycerate dehydrogenase [Saccharomonospora viridis]
MRIAILDDYQNVALELADWDSLNAEVRVFTEHIADPDELVRRLAGFDVVVAMRERTPFPESVLSRLPDLRLLVTTGQRNASIDVEAARRHGILVCGTGYLPHPTVELTWALILAACRNLPTEFQAMRDGGWQTTIGTGLRGKTLGVLGLGRLGSQVARVGQAFGMRTIAWSQNLTAERAAEHDVTAVSKDELLAASDVLTVHLVLSARTRGLIGAAELAAMKPTALLVNTSRGPIVDEDALIRALREGSIGGAALDVYDEEPLPADHPLRTLPNVVLTPHIGFVTRDVYEVFYRDAVADIAAYQAGAPVRVIEP